MLRSYRPATAARPVTRGAGRPAPGARGADRSTGRSRRKSGRSTSMIGSAGIARVPPVRRVQVKLAAAGAGTERAGRRCSEQNRGDGEVNAHSARTRNRVARHGYSCQRAAQVPASEWGSPGGGPTPGFESPDRRSRGCERIPRSILRVRSCERGETVADSEQRAPDDRDRRRWENLRRGAPAAKPLRLGAWHVL